MTEEEYIPRCGDTVYHRPSRETWQVAWCDGVDLAPSGWPDSIAKLEDCEVRGRCNDECHRKAVKEWEDSRGGDRGDTRQARVAELYGMVRMPRLDEFTRLNVSRCNRNYFPLSDRHLSHWVMSIAEEVGEMSRELVRVNNCRVSRADAFESMLKEVADAYTYLDLFAAASAARVSACVTEALISWHSPPLDLEAGFDDLALASRVTVGCVREMKSGEWHDRIAYLLSRILKPLGQMGHYAYHRFNFGWSARQGIGEAALILCSCAHALDRDLGGLVAGKFNEVSDRVGSRIRIG